LIKEGNLNLVCQIIAGAVDDNSEIITVLRVDFTDNISFYGNDQRNEEGNDFTGDQENQPKGEEPIAGIGVITGKDQRSRKEIDNLFLDYGYESQIDEGTATPSHAESAELNGSKEITGEIQQAGREEIVSEIKSLPLSRVEGPNEGQKQAIQLNGRSDYLIIVLRKRI